MTVRTVPVVLPEKVWGRLASLADVRGVTTAEVLGDAVVEFLVAQGRPVEPPVEVDQLAVLDAELNAARAAGYRVPSRRKKSTGEEGK